MMSAGRLLRKFPLMVRQHKGLTGHCSEVETGTLSRKMEGKKKNACLWVEKCVNAVSVGAGLQEKDLSTVGKGQCGLYSLTA